MCVRLAILLLILTSHLCVKAQSYDSISLKCPNRFITGQQLPVEIRLFKNNSLAYIDTTLYINFNSLSTPIEIRKGRGSGALQMNTSEESIITIENTATSIIVQPDINIITSLSGTYSSNLTLHENHSYHITEDLIINSSSKFSVEKGAIILIAPQANIIVNGSAQFLGSYSQPIVVAGFNSSEAWGGIMLNAIADTSVFENTMFIDGGGNPNYIFGHSQSQAVVRVENTNAIFENCCFISNPGKAVGGLYANILMKNCLISHCDTGAEFYASKAEVDSCHVLFIPDNDGILDDDDNDGMYFSEVHPSQEACRVSNSFFIVGEDDGIDHNGAILIIENCWIEGFENEGIACSNKNTVHVFNTMIRNCNQAIECGYGNASVTVNHCVIIDNNIGARFGDEYPSPSSGNLEITNSVFYNNLQNLLNYDPQVAGPIEAAMQASYSITNNPDFDNTNYCIAATPVFNRDFCLHPSSPGYGMASDGFSMGLLSSLLDVVQCQFIEEFTIFPNPAAQQVNVSFISELFSIGRLSLYSLDGRNILSRVFDVVPGVNEFSIHLDHCQNGIYIMTLEAGNKLMQKILVINE